MTYLTNQLEVLYQHKTTCPYLGETADAPDTLYLPALFIQMSLLDHSYLSGHRQHRLAHLQLGIIVSGYVWAEGTEGTVQVSTRTVHTQTMFTQYIVHLPMVKDNTRQYSIVCRTFLIIYASRTVRIILFNRSYTQSLLLSRPTCYHSTFC